MKTLIIYHEGAEINEQIIAPWLASFSDLVGIVVLSEKRERVIKRIRREFKRVGLLHFADVMAFRLYYRLVLAKRDDEWQHSTIDRLRTRFPQLPSNVPILHTDSPNSADAKAFIQQQQPEIVIARCKTLLKAEIFTIPTTGTFVMHPGVCPEYRNAHGCFWALVQRDLGKVGMTLLKIDKGVDTGPIFGHYSYAYDEVNESHIVIQQRVVLENLAALAQKLQEIHGGSAVPVDVSGRPSATWGQPWLTSYLRWKWQARKSAKPA